jgi:Photosynthesis system II assembly factor YCF48/Putative zinc-finger
MSDVPSRMLRETLRHQLVPPPPDGPSGCFNADMLAAWSDGTLSRRDRAMVESHAATCARCQAMLAAMARTAAPLPARKWWQASTVRWLVPIATVSALAIAVWVKLPTERQPTVMTMRTDRGASSVSAPVAELRPGQVAAPAAKATDKLERPADSKRTERRGAGRGQPSTPTETSAPSSAPVQTPSAETARERADATASLARDASAPEPVQAPGPPPAQPLVQPPDQTASVQAPVQPPVRVTAQSPVDLRSAAARSRAPAGAAAIAPARTIAESRALIEIPSPNRNVRWRIVAGTSVERSTDGGATWQVQSTGATGRLTAGAAPSPTTCWLVGTGGVVLVSKDGRTWQRVAIPETVDLAGVFATDDSNAKATAADGRVFSTTDGGKTWRSP